MTPPTVYRFKKGKSYPIKLIHLGTNCDEPDFDYTAAVTPAGNDCVSLDDPHNLLGVVNVNGGCGFGASTNQAAGKTATLHLPKIQSESNGQTECTNIGDERTYTVSPVPDCDPAAWQWSITGPATILTEPPTGQSVVVRFDGMGQVTLSMTSNCCSTSITIWGSTQAKGLIITTIEDNSSWPGPRPALMEARLGYPVGSSPSDDQILFDVVMNIPGGWVQKLNQWAQGIYQHSIDTPVGGKLVIATEDDKKWLTLAMLKRSVNPTPAAPVTEENLFGEFGSGGEWRLINGLSVCASISNGTFETTPQGNKINNIGPTKYRISHVEFTVNSGAINGAINNSVFTLWVNTADPADGNDQMLWGATIVLHRTAGRIGPPLEPYERALIPKRAGPFFSGLGIGINGDTLDMFGEGSQNSQLRWPTARIYKWVQVPGSNPPAFHYTQIDEQLQAANPFEWINQFGTPWP